jgi:4-aminobutyrate aminotransferase-like enzyme
VSRIPAQRSRLLLEQLRRFESPVLAPPELPPEEGPIVWASARGCHVEDVDGHRYLDAGAAFAVAAYGHAHPELVAAVCAQSQRLMHAMGDVYASENKGAFLERLAGLLPGDLEQSILGLSGADAVEAAIKTAALARPNCRTLAFHNAYHGLSLGALGHTAYRDSFRSPFAARLGSRISHAPYPYCYRCPMGLQHPACGLACLNYVRHLLDSPVSGCEDVGAVLVEPIQGRGGIVIPPAGWLKQLAELCAERSILLILDEIYTGFGRTGRRFACEHEGVVPDLICLGKAMSGGFPISAAVGTVEVMSAWRTAPGEARHTSTFLGHPVGCAVALAALEIFERERLEQRSARLGAYLLERLRRLAPDFAQIGELRGSGLMCGVELVSDKESRAPASELAWEVVLKMRRMGVLLLSSGSYGNVLSFTPPLIIEESELDELVMVFERALREALG